MSISARPVDTRLGSTLMGQVLPSLIKNRVGFGFKKKKNPKWVWVGFRFLQKPSPNQDLSRPSYIYIQLLKYPHIYINIHIHTYSYNPKIFYSHLHLILTISSAASHLFLFSSPLSHTLTHNLTVAVALKRLKLNSSFYSHSQALPHVIKPHATDVSPPSSDQENPRTSPATFKQQAPRKPPQPP